MASPRERLDALKRAAKERGLTPVSWWIGEQHHEGVLDALVEEGEARVEVQAGRLTRIDGLDVKVLSESPMRFALWCKEGVLDL